MYGVKNYPTRVVFYSKTDARGEGVKKNCLIPTTRMNWSTVALFGVFYTVSCSILVARVCRSEPNDFLLRVYRAYHDTREKFDGGGGG